jgi:ERCC4-type nuclease
MCLILDRRESSRPAGRELISLLRRYDLELSTEMELEFGDAAFLGNGESGETMIGIEHKRLSDLIASMKDRRLSGYQLRGLWQQYSYVFLFVEGCWRPGSGGEIEELGPNGWRPFVGSRDRLSVNYRQVIAYLNSLSLRSRHPDTGEPLRVIRSQSPRETAAQYAALYFGFTEKRWDEHHAHDQIYTEVSVPKRAGLTQKRVTVPWRIAAQIPGIDRNAENVVEKFRTVRGMVLAGLSASVRKMVERYYEEHPGIAEKAWREVRGIGEERARQAVKALREEDEGR